ncbi:acyltransferase family protein [Lysobacter niastensis]|uniref:Acyltransferase n=1 Tax=Lysobacter niastensis TaxID=380629 RepID=A0ABS0B977_9GAMM|nr:acyltransferase [Lysobacter niastensis]MBF6023655.1 acyltransferase [Lysobacter niastensis]
MRPTRIQQIDLLRFLAAMMVVFFHYGFRGYAGERTEMPYPLLAPVAQYGYLGVQLFFMISGFVILMTASHASLRGFVVSRAVRLYPAFWICCTLTFLATLVLGADRFQATATQYLLNLTMLGGFLHVKSIDGVYWSLFVELQFYAFVALLLVLGQIRRAETWLVLWLLATAVIEWLDAGTLRALLITAYSGYFIAGATCYLIHQHGWSANRIALIVAAWLHVLYQAAGRIASFEQVFHVPISTLIVLAIITSFFAVMLLVATRGTSATNARWVALGALTYPLYLLHQNIGYMAFNALYPAVNPHVLFWSAIATMLIASHVAHLFLERPLSRRLRYLLDSLLDLLARAWRPWTTEPSDSSLDISGAREMPGGHDSRSNELR